MKFIYALHFVLIFLVIYLLAGCEPNHKIESKENDIAAIKQFIGSSGKAVNEGNVEAEVNRFTEDGIYMWPDAPSIIGHEALRNWFVERFDKVKVNINNENEELEVCDNWAFERGTYITNIQPKEGGKTVTIRGKYLNILKKQPDGSWKISLRIRNRDHKINGI